MTDVPTATPVDPTTEGPVDPVDTLTTAMNDLSLTDHTPTTNTPATSPSATPTPATQASAAHSPVPAVSAMPAPAPTSAPSPQGQRVLQLNQAMTQNLSADQRVALGGQRDAALAELVGQVGYRPGAGMPSVVARNAVVDRDLSGDLAIVRDSLFPDLHRINPTKLGPLDNNCHIAVQIVDRMLGGHPLQVAPKSPPILSLGTLERQMGGKFGPPVDLKTTMQNIGALPPGSRGVLAWSFPTPLPGHTEPRTGHLVNVVTLPGGHQVIVDGQAGDLATLPGGDENPQYQFMPTHVPASQQSPGPTMPVQQQANRTAPPQHPAPQPFGARDPRGGLIESAPPEGFPSIASVLHANPPASPPPVAPATPAPHATPGTVTTEGNATPGPVAAEQVPQLLAGVPKVTVFVENAANFGHQAAATMLIDSLNHLGYHGEVTIAAHPDVHQKLAALIGPEQRDRLHWSTLDFDPEHDHQDVRDTGGGIGDSLLVVAASDTIDADSSEKFLNAMGADRALVLQPHAWHDPRRLLVRGGPGQPVESHDLGGPHGDAAIDDAALYQFPPPRLSPDQLNNLLSQQPPALTQIVGAVNGGHLDLMPAYGLHNLAPENRATVVPTLAAGIHQSAQPKPAVILEIGGAHVDYAPPYHQDWLGTANLDDPDLGPRIDSLGPGDVLVVRVPRLPQDLFRHLYGAATLPSVLEGANTANLAQLQGKPYLSVTTKTTPYPHRDVPGADQLQKVSDGLEQGSGGWHQHDEENHPLFDGIGAADQALALLPKPSSAGPAHVSVSHSQVAPAARVLGDDRTQELLGGDPDVDKLFAYNPMRDLDEPTVTLPDTAVSNLTQALSDHRSDLATQFRAAQGDRTLTPNPTTVTAVANAIRDLRTPGSTLDTYQQTVTTRAHDPSNDQLRQGLRHLLATGPSTSPATGPATHGGQRFGARSTPPTGTTPDPFAPGKTAFQALQTSDPTAADKALADAKTLLAHDGVTTPPDGMAEAVAGARLTNTAADTNSPASTSTSQTGTNNAPSTDPADTDDAAWRGIVDSYYAPKLPAYLTDGLALGADAQVGPAVGGPDIAGMVRTLTGKDGWQGLDVVQRAAEDNVASLTGGRNTPFTVYHNGKPYELTLTARPDFGAASHWRPGGDSLSAKTKVTLKDSTGAESTRDHTASVPLTASAAPGMSVTVTPTFSTVPTDKDATKTTGQVTGTSSAKLGDQVEAQVPVRYQLSIVDKAGQPVSVTDHAVESATAQVPMRVPRDLGQHGTLGSRLARTFVRAGSAARPSRTQLAALRRAGIDRWSHSQPHGATVEAVTVHPRGPSSFTDQLSTQLSTVLGGKTPPVGSEARARLQAFAAKLGDPDEVAKMTAWDPNNAEEGWTSSDPIPGRNHLLWTGGARTMQMRVVPTWVKVDGTTPGTEHGHGTGLTFGSEASHTTGRSGGVSVSGGPAVSTGAVNAAAGPQVGHSRTSEHTTELKQSTASENTVNLPGDGVRYQIAFEVQVRTLGGPTRTLDGVVSAAMWSHPTFAPGAESGAFHEGDSRQHYGPAGFEHGSDASAHLVGLSGHNDLFDTVATALRDVPTKQARLSHEMFVRQFQDPALGTTLSAKISRVLERSEQLRQALSEPELRALRQTLAGPGLYIPVTHRGRLHDHTTVLLVRSRIDNVSDGPALVTADPLPSNHKAEDTVSTKHKDSRSHTTQLGANGRVSSLAQPQAPAGAGGIRADLRMGRDASTSLETKHTNSTKHAETLEADGKLTGQRYRQFQADVHLSVDMLAYRRRNAAGRWLLPNRPGRHVPTFQKLTARFPFGQPPNGDRSLPASLTTTLRGHYLVPESLVTSEPPPAAPTPHATVTQLTDPSTPRRLPGGSRDLDGARLLGFSGSAQLHTAARDLLAQAARDDPITRFPEADLVAKLQQLFSPDRIAGDPRRYSRPTVVTSSYQRGRSDLSMAVGLSLRPELAGTQVTRSEWEQATHDLEATLTADAARTWKASLGGYVTGTLTGKLGTGPAGNSDTTGNGLLVATVGPGGEVGGGHTVLAGGGQKLTVGHEPEKVYLAKVSHVATLVAEAQHKGNLDWMELFARPAPGRAGATVAVPGTDLVWLTGKQLAALGRPDPEAPPADPNRTLPVPPALDPRQAAGPSIGLGGLVDPVDLSDTITQIREELTDRLGAAADALLPPDTVSAGTDTHQGLTNLLSTVHHEGSNLLNGGVAMPVRQEFRWKGHTYLATVHATFTPDSGGGRVGHEAKLELSQSAKLSSSHVSSHGRQLANYTVAGRLGPTGVTHTEGHTAPGTGGVQSGAQLGGQLGRRSGSRTETGETIHEQSVTASGPVGRYGGRLDVTIRLQHGDDGPAALVSAGRQVTLTTVPDSPLPRPRGDRYGASHPSETLPTTTDPGRWLAEQAGTALPKTGAVYGEHFFGRIDDVVATATQALAASGVTVDGALRAQLRTSITASALKAGLPEMAGTPLRVPVPGSSHRVLDIYGVTAGRPRFGGVSAGIGLDGKTTVKDTVKADQDSGHVTQASAQATATAGDGLPHGTRPHPFGAGTGTTTFQSTVYDSTGRTTLSQPGERSREATRKPAPDPGRGTDPLTRTQLHDVHLLMVVRDTRLSGRPTDAVRAVRSQRFDDAYASRTWDADAAAATGHPTPEPLATAAKDLHQAGTDWTNAVRALNGTRAAAHATERAIAADRVALAVARRALVAARARYHAAQLRAVGAERTPDDTYDALAALLEARAAVRTLNATLAAHLQQLAQDRDPAALTAAQDAALTAEEAWWRARDAWYEQVLSEQDRPYHHELLPATDDHPQVLITVADEAPAPAVPAPGDEDPGKLLTVPR